MHGISPYILKVTDEDGVLQDLWNLNNIALIDYLNNHYAKDFFGKPMTSQESLDGIVGKNYIFDRIYKGTGESFAGRFSTGEYGYEAEIYDVKQKNFRGRGGEMNQQCFRLISASIRQIHRKF